jgi:hypothetical protein
MAENIRIKELNLDTIPPFTSKFEDPDYKGGVKLVVIGKPGCFAPGTEVLMFNGETKKVEEVKIGDVLMGDDNTPRTVQELYHDEEEMFEIKPNKGDSYTVNLKHDLVLECTGYNQGSRIIISVNDYLQKSKTWQNRWKLIRSSGISWDKKEVQIDPYFLGLWLGDGTSASLNIDTEVIGFCEEYANKLKAKYRYSITNESKNKNKLLSSFKSHGLLNNKHIPFDYKINDRETRLQILAGLIDTDGHLNCNGKMFEITQKNKTLADDMVFIARSLGFASTVKEVVKYCIYNGERKEGTYYRVNIYGSGLSKIPTKVLRKQFKEEPEKNKNHLVTGFKVIPKGVGEYYGFSLDKNRLFLLKSCDIVKNTGKSTLIKSIIYAKKHIFPVGIAMNGTEDTNHLYKSFMPSTFVYNEYREDKIEDLIKRQKIAIQHLHNPWAVLIIDDCTEDPTIFNKPLQVGLYKKGRHWSLMYILALQYAMDIRPNIRTSIDGIFILREPLLKNRRTLYENYASVIPDFEMFCTLMDQLTDNYMSMYIHNFTTSNNWQDCVFWYKAKPPPDEWKFGCSEYWEFHRSRYNEEYSEPVD